MPAFNGNNGDGFEKVKKELKRFLIYFLAFVLFPLESLFMKLIGKGSFTRAYLLPDGQTVKLVTNDPCKECAAMFAPNSPIFPKLECDGYEGERRVYKMKYYPKQKSLKKALAPRDYKLYQYLRKVNLSLWGDDPHLARFKEKLNEIIPTEFAKEILAICEHIDALNNYGDDMKFEISPRNVAVDNGKLILLDCFFKRSYLFARRNGEK